MQPLNLQERTVPHSKDLIHICLETKSKGHGMTFNMIYVCSKYPYFISYRGIGNKKVGLAFCFEAFAPSAKTHFEFSKQFVESIKRKFCTSLYLE